MSLRRNFLAGFAGSAWTALLALAAIPLYIRWLGLDAYGLIGFFLTLQVSLQVLDLGLAPAMNREAARGKATGELDRVRNLMHSLARVYWVIAVLIAALVWFAAPWIAAHWLSSEHLSPELRTEAVRLMGLVIACRWPAVLYQNAVMGSQRLVLANALMVVSTTLATGGALAVLAFVATDVQTFFRWQLLAAIVHLLLMRTAAWRVLGRGERRPRFDIAALKGVAGFALGMGGQALVSVLLTQIDKLLLSRLLDLRDFGLYMLAVSVVGSLYLLVSPVFNAVFPRFSALVARNDTAQLAELYRLGTRMLAALLFPAAVVLILFGQELVALWTGNTAIAYAAAPVIALMAAGSALHGIMNLPYAAQLAYGRVRLSFVISFSLLALQAPLVVVLTLRYGVIGAAWAWLLLYITYLLLGSALTASRVMPQVGWRWLLVDVGIFVAIAAALVLARHGLFEATPFSGPGLVAAIPAIFFLLGIPVLVFRRSRQLAGEWFWRRP